MGEGRKARGSRAVLSNRNFVLLWWGEIFSRIGDGISQIALIWLVLEMTGSGAAVGTVVAVYTAAALLFGLPGGALADRWNRKKLMILSGIFSALFVAMIPILYTSLGLSIPLLAGLVFLLSTASQFFEPALDATIPNIVPESQLMNERWSRRGAIRDEGFRSREWLANKRRQGCSHRDRPRSGVRP